MLARLANFLLTRTAIGAWLDGRKSLISALLIFAAGLLEILRQLAPLFPDSAYLSAGAEELRSFLQAASETLAAIGFGGLAIGLTHKAAKAKFAKDEDE